MTPLEQALHEHQEGPQFSDRLGVNREPLADTLAEVATEVARAEAKHRPMQSAHEGYAVLLEEVDELWDEVKKQTDARGADAMRKEAMQIAATAVRFMRDITPRISR